MSAMSENHSEQQFARAAKKALFCLPLYALVPVLFAIGFWIVGYGWNGRAFVFGALGWLIALVLRFPILTVADRKLPKETAMSVVGASSGVLEESIRVIVLALTSYSASWAVSIGQGWAAIEVLFTMVNVVVIASLTGKTDEKSTQVKQVMETQGLLHASPLWGILERIWASAFHIGCTLVVASMPWLVIALIPFHSLVNLYTVRISKQSIRRGSLFIAICGVSMLALGIWMIDR